MATIDLQARNDLEVVLVDDGSTDGTVEWLKARAPSSFTLKILETGGIGPGRARNAGASAAQAPLVAFLDADDVWWPQKLGPQLTFHEARPEVGFSFTDYIHVDPESRTLGTCFEYWRCPWTRSADAAYFVIDDPEAKILGSNVVGTSTVVVRRDKFIQAGGFNGIWKSAEDWDLWLRMAAAAPVGCSTAVTMSYLVRPGSMTGNRRDRIDAMRAMIAKFEGTTSPSIRSAMRQAVARIDIAEAEAARMEGDDRKAALFHGRALFRHPGWRTGRALAADIGAIARRSARTLISAPASTR